MKKSEKLKGKEKVQEKLASRKRMYTIASIVGVAAIVILCVAVYFAATTPPVVVAAGDTVGVTYTGMFDNKTVFDTNVNKTPLTFTVGGGQMIPGFDEAVRGMKVNDKKTVTLTPDQAYGDYNPALVQIVPQGNFPPNQTITVGEQFYFQSSVTGKTMMVSVINVTSAGVAVDGNSPLVGQNLTFDIKVDSIQKAGTGSNATAAATS